ncbi:hypothetical protein LPJ53_004866 [Coemansia erecta]|uniref:Uncharacterized protein n=1 Tax=Coemansia erecta TaxID=147472 RepID=A0A9W8CPC9_9FUNG|nr:hypothetical protein LPJ53_004866 [Coemansia erecta]
MTHTVYSADNASTLYSRPSSGAPDHEKFIYPHENKPRKTPSKWCASRHVQRLGAAMLSGGIYPLYRRIRRCQQSRYGQPADSTSKDKAGI